MTTRVEREVRWLVSRAVQRYRQLQEHIEADDDAETSLDAARTAVQRTDLGGQVAVVTGSTRGIGLAVARALAQAGSKVVVNGRSARGVERAARAIDAEGGEVEGVPADVSVAAEARRLVETAATRFGGFDLLVNNAAVLGPHGQPLWEVAPAAWEETLAVNLGGAFLCAREAATWMRQHGVDGRILNVSSGAARRPAFGLAPYVVSKAGLEALTRALALEAGPTGPPIVVALELGPVRTRMTRAAFGREAFEALPPPESLVPALLYALSAPPELVHGRILAAWRLAADPEAEALMGGPLAAMERFEFPPLGIDGRRVDRFDPRFDVNDRAENPLGMPDRAREALHRAADEGDCARYPDERYPRLRRALSARLGLPEEAFTFGNGSAELVERAVRTFAAPGEEVVSNEPSWFMFDRFCETAGVEARKVPIRATDGGFDHDLEAVARAVSGRTRLVYLVSPSNPHGATITTDAFHRLLERVPPHVPIVVDEAYVEFSTRPETLRTHEVIPETDRRVIGIRTFSKFYGLAALRVGYAFAAPSTVRLFNRLEPLFVLSGPAEAAAVAALEDEEHAARTTEHVRREREHIVGRLREADLRCMPAETPFMFVESPALPGKVYRAFEERSVFLPRSVWRDRYILFPIGTATQNERNLEILCSL